MNVGPIGLMCMLAAKAAGATSVVLVGKFTQRLIWNLKLDINEHRLQVAKKLGATDVIHATADVSAEIKNRGLGPIDVTIECSGAEPAIRTAIRVKRVHFIP